MEKKTRRKFSADFKAKVVFEVLKERNTMEEIVREHELHPNQITMLKREFIENAAAAFATESDLSQEKIAQEAVADQLYSQIGQLKVENDWLKKKLQ